MTLTLSNTGTADVEGAAMSATAPTGWEVTYDTPNVTVPAGGSIQVVAHVTPSSEAIAGDYVMTITAKGTEASSDVQIRVRVETPQLWWIVGVGLIVLTFAGLYWVFRRYGRR